MAQGYVVSYPDTKHGKAIVILTQKGIIRLSVDDGAAFCNTFHPWGEQGIPNPLNMPYLSQIEVPDWMWQRPSEIQEDARCVMCLEPDRIHDWIRVMHALIKGE
jgi:hypothetical protein